MRNLALGLSALVTLAAIVPLSMADHDVFSDEYADGTQDWGAKGTANWTVIPGQHGGVLLALNNETPTSTASVAFAGQKTWEDYRYQVEVMRIGNNTTNPYVGMAWRLDSFKGFYLLAIRDGEYFFGKPDLAGSFTTLQTWTALSWLDADMWNEIKIITDADNHSFYLNDEHIQTISDATLDKGKIGAVVGPAAEAVFDNAHVSTLVDRVDTLPPVVNITSPRPEDAIVDEQLGSVIVLGGSMTLTVDVADTAEAGNESGIRFVRVYLDGEPAAFQTGHPASTYTFTLNVGGEGIGGRTVTVYAEDKAHHRAFDTLDILVVHECAGMGSGGLRLCAP